MSDGRGKPHAEDNFEFIALQEAVHYRAALLTEFAPYLFGHVLEIGAGIGQITASLLQKPGIKRLISVEPNPRFAGLLRSNYPQLEIVTGTIDDLPAAWPLDAILSINVLEHIEADDRELAIYRRRLALRQGTLCLFVPARPEILSPIDRDFGHFRRYGRRQLRKKLEAAGFTVRRLVYFNLIGYFAWWLNFRLLKKRSFPAPMVRVFDRSIFPLQYRFESRVFRPPIGQNLLAVATAAAP
jgi:hypothetical protein